MCVAKAAEARSSAQWPREAFHYMFNSAQLPPQRPRRSPPAASSSPPAPPLQPCLPLRGNLAMYLSSRRQVHFHISNRIESGVSRYVERRLLNKGVSGDGGKRSHLSISQMEKRWRGLIFLPATFITDIHVFLHLIYLFLLMLPYEDDL